MGLICSCFCVEDSRNPYGSLYRPCGCLSFLSQRFMLMYTLLLQREEHAAPSSSSSLAPVAPITDESYSSTFRSPPRPLAFDDPIFTRKRDDGPARRHEKTLTHSYEESESLSRVKNEGKIESACLAAKLCGYNCRVSTKCCSESSRKHSSTEIMSGATCMFPSSEEEDVCPTCLEEYTSDNPRIILQCSHHFHLGCIYEWMERRELCPICGKVMIFNETS
ncbi:E3 ubiquitin-protein ligase At3g02290-like isoform X2 [Phalaenopsis equestris]|uniref:E3 ubiquitin-protein ligase At3g02290-like isoform X2 n=1 Tax=Phalaenopsis equestris TaxID=78828 RepID=UPI0009E3CBA4|nr:E3 ubiquitin-protein ligase At3g02290-like isoform X2 [Phalaenopsis equestris]